MRVAVFFFQAEDGIRYWSVTGVQTCALPICREEANDRVRLATGRARRAPDHAAATLPRERSVVREPLHGVRHAPRSEERRVGKERRSRWARGHERREEGSER